MSIKLESQAICSNVFRLLREERERQGLSKYAIAQKTGLSQQTIGYVERGTTTTPSLDTILRIVLALGIDLGEVIRAARPSAKRPKPQQRVQ